MLSQITSVLFEGFEAKKMEIEVHVARGLSLVVIVGLPGAAVKESRDRVKSALLNQGFEFPQKKITINLAPAHSKKEGPLYDLPIAMGILAASGQIPLDSTKGWAFLGELSLDGRLRPIRGALLAASKLKDEGVQYLVIPKENGHEASMAEGIQIYPVLELKEIVSHLNQERPMKPLPFNPKILSASSPTAPDFGEVFGQEATKRAMTIGAAGGHNMLMVGPPGAGKTMLARCMPSILPPLTLHEMIEVTSIYSIAGHLSEDQGLITQRPFRSPHHTTSEIGLIGGGTFPKPGEISLAHLGILFLDELPEFPRKTIEVLRQPLEEGLIRIGRAHGSAVFPARILFLGAMNPCPCGYFGDGSRKCRCSPQSIQRYLSRISGPLLDRIDIQIQVKAVSFEKIIEKQGKSTTSQEMKKHVLEARAVQKERFQKEAYSLNSEMDGAGIDRYCSLSKDALKILKQRARHSPLSGRSYHKILKVARTIADLEEASQIQSHHLGEALYLRDLETFF
ncbi:MAG: ATP-binding protein, partial [Planctomycetota bacterium]